MATWEQHQNSVPSVRVVPRLSTSQKCLLYNTGPPFTALPHAPKDSYLGMCHQGFWKAGLKHFWDNTDEMWTQNSLHPSAQMARAQRLPCQLCTSPSLGCQWQCWEWCNQENSGIWEHCGSLEVVRGVSSLPAAPEAPACTQAEGSGLNQAAKPSPSLWMAGNQTRATMPSS